jgi:ABC-type hemin transport system substrate-binding protein
MRIASLVPSATELLYALGLGHRLVARTGFCIHPASQVSAVPKVGGTKDVNLSKLRAQQPTHVVLNVDENTRETFEALCGWPNVQVLVTHPCGPQDVPALLDQCVAAFGTEPGVHGRALALHAELQAELNAPWTLGGSAARSVLYLIWYDPWMAVARDTYISRLLAHAGWLTQPKTEGGVEGAARYPVLSPESAVWKNVDEIWLSSEPYRFDLSHLAAAQHLAPQAKVRRVDGELCSWWGARTAAGLAYLRKLHTS